MADKLWEDVKKGIKDTVSFVTEKTEELTSIGRLKLDIAGINRKIDKKFNELGRLVYSKLAKEEGLVLDSDEEVKKLRSEITDLEQQKKEKEAELEEVGKKESGASEAKEKEATTSDTPEEEKAGEK